MTHRIALIHAGAVSVEPVVKAFAELWPEAECANITDDSLIVDRAKTPEFTAALATRIERLAAYGRDLGANGILFTCSAFGPAIEAVQRSATWPVLKPNEAMFEAALQHGRRIGMVASFQNSIPQIEQEFPELVAAHGVTATIQSICVPAALTALQAGDVAQHNQLLAEVPLGSATAMQSCSLSSRPRVRRMSRELWSTCQSSPRLGRPLRR